MFPFRTRFWVAAVAPLVVLITIAPAFAQAPAPVENHYNVYVAQPQPVLTKTVGLRDQFGSIQVDELTLTWFANPTEKRVTDATGTHIYPILNPDIHLNWWRFFVSQPLRTIVVTDQFGSGEWFVGDAIFLLTPSLKNASPGALPPPWNHYLCYAAGGPQRNAQILIQDQFGNFSFVYVIPYVFCNPVEKTADGQIYPIIDAVTHLAVYQYFPYNPVARVITSTDQFGTWGRNIIESDFLCVPALKELPVGTQNSTWGKIKALYR